MSTRRGLAVAFSSSSVRLFPLLEQNGQFIPNIILKTPIEAKEILQERVSAALSSLFGDAVHGTDPLVSPSTKPEFGDYQCNAALALAKRLKSNPRTVAEQLMARLLADSALSEVVCDMDIAGPGFINMKITEDFLQARLTAMLKDEARLGIAPVALEKQQRIVVDFSSPNIAKDMHVGHLRSTIIGDTLSRVLEFIGHDVKRLNHVGDWGTQFGMLITYLRETQPSVLDDPTTANIQDLVSFYREAKTRFDEDESFRGAARREVVALQRGNAESEAAWRAICAVSRSEFQTIYDRLGVSLEERGESFYNPLLPVLVESLRDKQLVVESDGAQCVFVEGFQNAEGENLPLIVQKSDGGYLYATTDLAAVLQRCRSVQEGGEGADRVLYVTDAGQSQHFDMVFKVAHIAGIDARHESVGADSSDPVRVDLKHVPFGLVQGEDGKKFKTRSGDTVKLKALLDEAVTLAEADMAERSGVTPADLTPEQKDAARVIGTGAVKYADLSMNRESNYRFSFKKMLSLQGNTAPYMIYAYVRIMGIRRRAMEMQSSSSLPSHSPSNRVVFPLGTPEEMALAKALIRLPEVLRDVEMNLYPNKICEYIFDVSQKFNQFYERCPVLKADTAELRTSRTQLCTLSARTIGLALTLLGIDTVERL